MGASGLLALLLGLVSIPAHRAASADADAARSAPLQRVALTVPSLQSVRAVPRSYFGLSTEYWTLPIYEAHLRLVERVLSLLHVRGGGPMILRIGGDSADHARWEPHSNQTPSWVFRITPAWLAATRTLIAQSRLQVILDMNLVTGSPLGAAEWARAAEAKLPRGSIVGFEIGNEPDIYDRTFWVGALKAGRGGPLPSKLTAAAYRRDFQSYALRLRAVARRVPLIGPAIANPKRNAGWIPQLLGAPHPGLRTVSVHHYALSACAPRRASNYPTIARILSERSTAEAARRVGHAIKLAHDAGLPIKLTELNSVTCGGRAGVSDTFATALWAPDALFEFLRAGVDGVNLHMRAYTINAPFALTGAGLKARPLLYGMLMFARTLGPDAHLLRIRLAAPTSLQLKAWAVRLKGRLLHVLVIDKGSRPARVALHLPASAQGSVQRLLAPAVSASGGVTLAGQHLASDGRWVGARSVERISRGPHGYELRLGAHSAALLSVRTGGR